jgi:hypothetical protein
MARISSCLAASSSRRSSNGARVSAVVAAAGSVSTDATSAGWVPGSLCRLTNQAATVALTVPIAHDHDGRGDDPTRGGDRCVVAVAHRRVVTMAHNA